VLFRVSARMGKISLNLLLVFIAIGGQGVGGMNKYSASLYDERFHGVVIGIGCFERSGVLGF